MAVIPSFDAIVLGGGLSGVSTACRLQALGLRTAILEVHNQLGGCAGYYVRNGFSFDVGATTLVDFDEDGVGGQFLSEINLGKVEMEVLPGYLAWLPDRQVALHRDHNSWVTSRTTAFGDSQRLRHFWHVLDNLASIFWKGTKDGLRLPIRSLSDAVRCANALPINHWPKARLLLKSLGDHFDDCGLRDNAPLRGLMSMLCEDTLHARTIDDAPLINAALGTSIRGRIARPVGGFKGLWETLGQHYLEQGGEIHLGTKIIGISGQRGALKVKTKRGKWHAGVVVSSIPAPVLADICQTQTQGKVRKFVERDSANYGSGIVVCLGVPEDEVMLHEHRHHQILESYDAPLGNGNNMFISVSAAGDTASAPLGYRSVMISTHTDIDPWLELNEAEYCTAKEVITQRLLANARRVYPNLGEQAVIMETGTPRTYARFARRPGGAVGGVRINMQNSNQFSMPSDLGGGIYAVGDYTWPGLGSVACLVSSKIACERIAKTFP